MKRRTRKQQETRDYIIMVINEGLRRHGHTPADRLRIAEIARMKTELTRTMLEMI